MRKFITPPVERIKKIGLISIISLLLIAAIFGYAGDPFVQLLLMVFLLVFIAYQFYITAFLSFDTNLLYFTCFRIKKKIPLRDVTRIVAATWTEGERRIRFTISFKENEKESQIQALINPKSKRWRQFRFYTMNENPQLDYQV
ncbi:hypothetical protein [Pollutibacter soli]|uniref:hypothetical protein n=1 Tax=Pollutibacter soli TaxID=3034157 RepID=UPI0030140C3D